MCLATNTDSVSDYKGKAHKPVESFRVRYIFRASTPFGHRVLFERAFLHFPLFQPLVTTTHKYSVYISRFSVGRGFW